MTRWVRSVSYGGGGTYRKDAAMGKLGFVGKLMSELLLFARKEKIYWIVPLVLVLLLVALFIATSQAVAPFIYTLF